jgi:hypothetical protein
MGRTASAILAALTSAVLGAAALGAPASAQDQAATVAFDGVTFAFSPELGVSVNASRVPGQPTERLGIVPPDAPHITFTLYGTAREGERSPRIGWDDSTVRAYRIADIAGYPEASQQVEAVRALLADRSSLAGHITVTEDGGEPLPHLPLDTAAAQALRARATYVDTEDLSGIAYLVGYRQDVSPFAAGDFWYTFQALSDDGEWYVSGDFVVEASGFPERIRPRDQRGIVRRWTSYLEKSVATLDAAAPDTFRPSLASIDALIDSIAFEPAAPG